jgi:hypothetical protein
MQNDNNINRSEISINNGNCFTIVDNNVRTIYNRDDSHSVSNNIKGENHETDSNIDEINVNIYRFKFTDDFTNELYIFSKVHQYDHRKDFKDAWKIWVEENENLVDSEIRRLTNLGYDGDINDKMFKSARYYFRKKSTEKKEPTKRRVYQGVQKELLESMDTHIKANINDKNFKPSDGFDQFCREYIELIKEEVNQLCKNGYTDSNEIKGKIKKTYKNRYFLLISK